MVGSDEYRQPQSVTSSGFYCQYMLPCGFCKELKIDCPKRYGTNITYPVQNGTWTDKPSLNGIQCRNV